MNPCESLQERSEAGAPGAGAETRDVSGEGAVDGTAPLVLIVEDDGNVQRALRQLLESSGYRATATSRGEEAVRIARDLLPDAVLLDLILPGASGIDTVRVLREHTLTAGIPVIAMTGAWEDSLSLTDFDGLLLKPYTGSELFCELGRVLSGSSREDREGAA